MWEVILKTALESGLWAVLFCVLLLYQLRDGRARECKYRQTVDTLLHRLGTLENEVAAGVDETLRLLKRKEKKKSESEPARASVGVPAGAEAWHV